MIHATNCLGYVINYIVIFFPSITLGAVEKILGIKNAKKRVLSKTILFCRLKASLPGAEGLKCYMGGF